MIIRRTDRTAVCEGAANTDKCAVRFRDCLQVISPKSSQVPSTDQVQMHQLSSRKHMHSLGNGHLDSPSTCLCMAGTLSVVIWRSQRHLDTLFDCMRRA